MMSQKNKAQILSLNRGKNKKRVKVNERKECRVPIAESDVESQNCIIKDKKTEKKILVSFDSHGTIRKRIRKRKGNGDGMSRKTKIMRATSGLDDIDSSLSDDKISDSDLVVISETESGVSERISPFSDNLEAIKNYNISELCNESIVSSVSDNKLHSSSFYVKSPQSVASTPSVSKMSKSRMSLSIGSNLDVKENDKDASYVSTLSPVELVLPEVEINVDMDFSGLVHSEMIQTVVENSNSASNSNILYQNTCTDNSQCSTKNFVDFNKVNPKSYDIMTLLLNKLNEVKNSKESFICNQLKIQPIIKPKEFNYEHNSPFNIAVDISMLKAADDFIKENSSRSDDFPVISSDAKFENSWQGSLIKSRDLPLDFVNFISSDSNQFNPEDAESEISISSCNTADIQPDFFDISYPESPKKVTEVISNNLENYSWESLNNVDNFIQSQDLNLSSNETGNKQLENLCESVNLSKEVDSEKSAKFCTKVKRKRKKMNWSRSKRKCRKRNSTVPEVNGLLNEILCDTCDESDVDENLVSSEAHQPLPLNSSCLTTSLCLTKKPFTKILENKTFMVENSDDGELNADKEKSQRTTRSMMKSKCKENENNNKVKNNHETVSQIPDEEAFSFDTCKEEQVFNNDQAKLSISEPSNSIVIDAYSKISCGNLGSLLSVESDTSYSNQNDRNPDQLYQRNDDNYCLKISEKNSRASCNLSLEDEKNTIRLKHTSKGKDIKLLKGLIVGIEKLDELTLNKYCKATNVQGSSNKSKDSSTEHGSNHFAVEIGDSEPLCSNSEETQVHFSSLQNDVQLHTSQELSQQENLNLKEHLNLFKKAKHALEHKSKSEEDSLLKNVFVSSKHSKKHLKTGLKTKNTLKRLDDIPTEKMKKCVDVLRSKSEENVTFQVSSSCKELNIESEQSVAKLKCGKTLNFKSKEKDITDASGLSISPEKHLKTIVLHNTNIISSGEESNNVSHTQSISVLKSKIGEKSTPGLLVLSKNKKKHLKTIDSTSKDITCRKESKKASPKQKEFVTGLEFETEENGCSEDLDLNKLSGMHLKINSPKTKIASSGEQSNVTSEALGPSKHPENHSKTDISKTATTHGEVHVSSEQKPHRSDDYSACKEVNNNKKYKNDSDTIKAMEIRVTKLSSKNVDSESKVKISRKQMKEASKSLPHLTVLSNIGKKESKNCKAKCGNKSNEKEQNIVKSISKSNSKIVASKNCNSNLVPQNLSNKNFDLVNVILPFNSNCHLSNESNFSGIVRNMKRIPKLSHKKKTEKSASDINESEESKKYSSHVKLTVDNSANLQSPSTQSSYKNNANDISSLKLSDDASEAMILIEDEPLDFEPDQSDDLSAKHSACNIETESLCTIINQVNNEIPTSVQEQFTLNSGIPESDVIYSESNFAFKDSLNKELDLTSQASQGTNSTYPYNDLICSRNFFTPLDKDLLSEDDSDSDDDHSFKRTRERKGNYIEETSINSVNFNNCKENRAVQNEIPKFESEPRNANEVCSASFFSATSSTKSESLKSSCDDQDTDSSKSDQTNCLKSKVSAGSVSCLNDVLAQINKLCSEELFNEAVEITKKYFVISSSDIKKCILQKLLDSIFPIILRSDKNSNSTFKIFDDILNLVHHFNICNKKIASFFITKCYSHPHLINYSIQLFHICQKENIPLDTEAIKAFSLALKSDKISFNEILGFVNYVKLVCNKKVPKELVHLALKKCETLAFSDIHHTCSLLHGITPKEVEEHNLKEFILLCFEKNLWQHVAEMFIAWGSKNCLSISIYSALTSDYETMGKYFRKFANYVHEKEGSLCPELKDRLTPELKARFGQMGTALMLIAFSKKEMDTALDVLYTLHAYNVNYFELQLAMESSLITESNLETENYSTKIFPFSVVFVAIDICLHLSRPKDAFTIFQDFSWLKPDASLDDAVKTYAINGRYQRLLKLVPLLNSEDSLNEGWEALENLLTTVKQDLAYEIAKENIKDLASIYNKYLVSLLNSEIISSAYILYQYSLGPKKDIFTISSEVLRGLVVAFYKDGRDTVANSLFLLGVMRQIYPIQMPNLENFPWQITLMTHWTTTEIKVAVEWFIGVLFSLLMEKPKETNFEQWFSIKIAFNITRESTTKIKCLKETVSDSKYYITNTKDALHSMNPSLEVTGIINENALCITSDSLYNFWKSRCPDAALKFICLDMQFVKLHDENFSFGGNGNCSKERESSIFVKKFLKETCTPSNSPETIRESQNSVESLQSLSPCQWQKHSASDVFEMIDEIKASTSTMSYVPTTPEQSPSGQNLIHDSPSRGCWFTGNDILRGGEQIREFQHQVERLSSMLPQTISPNRLTDGSDKSINQTKTQQTEVSDINQSQNESEILTKSSDFQSHLADNSKSMLLYSYTNDFHSTSTKTKDCLSNSNKSPRASSVCPNTTPSGIKNNLLPNNTKKKGKIIPHSTPVTRHSPKIDNKEINTFINTSLAASMIKKKRKRKKAIKQLIAAYSTDSRENLTVLLKAAVANVRPTMRRKKFTAPVEDSLLKSRNISLNEMSAKKQKIVAVKKGKKLKVDNSSNKFQNFTVCITPSERTVKSSFNQSLPGVSETIQSNEGMNETSLTNPKEKPSSVIHHEVPVPNSSLNHTLPTVSKTTQNDDRRVETKAGPSSSLSCKVLNSNVTFVKLPLSKGQENKQELNELNITSRTPLKETKSPIQSEDSLSKTKFTKTVNLDNISNAESNDTAINASFQNSKNDQHKTKPVIKRNFSTSFSKNLNVASKDKILNHATVASGSGTRVILFERSEKITDSSQNFKVNRVFKENSEISTPVSGSSSHSDEVFSKIIKSNEGMNETSLANTEEKPCSVFHHEVPVSNSPLNHSLPTVSKTIKNNDRRMETKAGPSSSLSCKVLNSNVTSVRLPLSKDQENKQELNELNITSQTALKEIKSPIHSIDSLSKIKFTKTVKLNNIPNAESIDTAINAPFQNLKNDQHKTMPVKKRNFSTSFSKNLISVASKDKMANRATVASGSGTRVILFEQSEKITNSNQNFQVNRVFKENSDISTPVSGSSSFSDKDFDNIMQFLKRKVTLNNKNLSPEEQDRRALSLAQAFISNTGITKLEKRNMKLLTEFADLHA